MGKTLQQLINEKDYNEIFSRVLSSKDIDELYSVFTEDAVHNAIIKILSTIHRVVDAELPARYAGQSIIKSVQKALEELDDYELTQYYLNKDSLQHISDNVFRCDDIFVDDICDKIYAQQICRKAIKSYENLYPKKFSRNVNLFIESILNGRQQTEVASEYGVANHWVRVVNARMIRFAKLHSRKEK